VSPTRFHELDVGEVRRRVVDPVVAGLLRTDELDEVAVWWQPPLPELWFRVVARGEEFSSPIWSEAGTTIDEVAADVASRLEDWVCETRFAWGEQRLATYELPGD
jgi:hypothetical protein